MSAAWLPQSRRERFWLRVVSFAVRRANKAAGPYRGMAKYQWTRPARPDDVDIEEVVK